MTALRDRPFARAIGVGAASLLLFSLLRSQQYTAVDGALRCLDVFRHPALQFSGNNHLLYPVWVLGWHRTLGLLGVGARDAVDFMRLTQLMNAAAAAGTVALVYWLLQALTASETAALAAAAGLALSRAFLLHATNAAEPMTGLFWSLVALACALAAARSRAQWPAALAGIAVALAAASYLSMAALVPALAVILLRSTEKPRRTLAVFGACGLLAGLALLAFASAHTGARTPGEAMRRAIDLPAGSVWLGASVARFAKVPLGLAQALWPVLPADYGGLRSLFGGTASILRVAWLAAALTGVAALVVAAALMARSRWAAWTAERRTWALALAVGLVCAALVPPAWDPLYDKLWLLPLALGSLLLAVVLAGKAAGGHAAVGWAAVGLVTLEAAVNLTWAVPAHLRESPYLEPARLVAATVRPPDLVVLNWDPVSETYSGLFGGKVPALTLPTEAVLRGPAALTALDSAVAAASLRGGNVYFLGLLDETPVEWNAFLGSRLHVPFASLGRYREQATIVARFQAGRTVITLRRL